MSESILFIVFGLGLLLIIGYSLYKGLRNRKNLGTMYTPYDDMTQGTIDVTKSRTLEEDTRHTIPIEQTQEVEEEIKL